MEDEKEKKVDESCHSLYDLMRGSKEEMLIYR